MSKFANKSFAPSTTESSKSANYVKVDWNELNKYVAETVQEAVGCEEGTPSGAIGIISGIVDYGKHQDPERVEAMDDGDEKTRDWKDRMVQKGKATVEDGMFHYQAPPCREVGFYVDFPSITVDKGTFFGESNPAPYRVLLGGVFMGEPAQKTKIQGYPNSDNVWVFGDKNRATKLAKAAKLKGLKNGFPQERLLELIGTAMVFNVEVFINDAGYLQEKVTNPSPIMAGTPIPTIDEDLLFYVGMNEDNEEDYVKVVTRAAKNYCKLALDYEGSKLASQFEKLEAEFEASKEVSTKEETPKASPKAKVESKPQPKVEVEGGPMDFDDDIPF